MKNLKLLLLSFIFVFIGCNSMQKKKATDEIKKFIAGTYIRTFEGDYSFGNDTLVIEQPNANSNYYIIQHRMSYRQIKNKQPLPVEYKIENWTAVFNKKTNVLEEQTRGKHLSFLPEENGLLLGASKFRKIK